jgi:hypothetical protein
MKDRRAKKRRAVPLVDQENSIGLSHAWLKCLNRQNWVGPARPSASRRLAGQWRAGICRKGRGRIILSGPSGSASRATLSRRRQRRRQQSPSTSLRQGWLVAGRMVSFLLLSNPREFSGQHGCGVSLGCPDVALVRALQSKQTP